MKERPILFNSEMVRAVLDSRKTVTRRVVKAKVKPDADGLAFHIADQQWCDTSDNRINCPYGVPGDRLWVRETWGVTTWLPGKGLRTIQRTDNEKQFHKWLDLSLDQRNQAWRAFLKFDASGGGGWTPSIHMPRWASRILLEVVSVRVERVGDISEGDAKAEGCDPSFPITLGYGSQYRRAFAFLWDSINAKRGYGWNINPWVWVVEFKRADI